jgi:prepilin-type N-terminal cleavage/methylation domain-containing protein
VTKPNAAQTRTRLKGLARPAETFIVAEDAARERGFTLIEVLVALLVLGIVMTALAPAFYGSLKATALTNERSVANGLAVADTEQVRAIPYYEVGYHSTYLPATCPNNSNTVLLDSNVASPGPFDQLPTTQKVGPVTYTMTRCVNWIASSSTTNSTGVIPGSVAAYKQSVVTVSWTIGITPYSISQTSAIYPGGEGQYSSAQNNYPPGGVTSTTAAAAPPVPTGLTATKGISPTNTNTIALSWSESAPTQVANYVVQYNSVPTGQTCPAALAAGSYTSVTSNTIGASVSGLTAGTIYCFQVVAQASGGVASAASTVATATTDPITSTSCLVNSLSVTPTSGVADSNDFLVGVIGFTLLVNAQYCTNVTVAYSTDGTTPSQATLISSGGSLIGTAGIATTPWTVGNHTFTVWVGGVPYASASGNPVVVQVNICQEHGHSGNC